MHRVLLLLALLFAAAVAEDPSDPAYLLNRIYRTYTEATESPCVRLLNETTSIGCGEAFPVRAPLIGIANEKQFVSFLERSDSESMAVVMPASFFTRERVEQLAATKRLAGILVEYSANAPASSWSPAEQNPNQQFGLRPSQFFPWNPSGSSWSFEKQPVPIVWLSNDTTHSIQELLVKQSDSYPKWVVEFNSEMWATQNSKLCFERGFCLPVGGQSPWATLAPLNKTKDIIMVVAGLDTNAFFHGNAKGAVSSVSGVAALLGAYIALSQIPNEVLLEWEDQVVFAFFQAEAWGYSGSKRFVKEIDSFVCRHGESENGCSDPFKSSLAFTNLKLEKVRYLIEAKQVGSTRSDGLYLHREKDSNKQTETILAAMRNTGIAAHMAAQTNPGIPPSSAHSFLLQNSGISAVVVTDHSAAYSNQFYDSDFDQLSNVNAARVCDASNLIAKTVAGLMQYPAADVNVDCELVTALVGCLVSNLSCSAAFNWTHYTDSYVVSNYVGVFQWTNSWTMNTDFVWRVLNGTKPLNGTVNLHDALSPAFEYDENTGYWKIVDSTQPTWTESYWNTLSIRIFLQESWAADATMLMSGVVSTSAFTAALFYFRKSLGFESVARR